MFDEAQRNLIDILDALIDSGAKLIEDTAITLVPVRTSLLKSTIRTLTTDKPMERIARAGDPAQGCDYAPFVEYGTYRARAQPFMRPAAEARGPEVAEMIRQAMIELFS